MTAVQKILEVAAAEIGTKENPAGSNRVKYNTEYYGNDVASSARPWCCSFVWWVFKNAELSDLFYDGGKCAHCATLQNFYKKEGQLVTGTTYRPGDLVFFQFDKDAAADHIGIVERDNGDTVTTIEGNTSTDNNANGGRVMRRTRKKSLILAAARPRYTSDSEEVVDVKVSVLKKGDKGDQVKALQALLIGYGYDLGRTGADGRFGPVTESCVRKYQSRNGLQTDGSVGPATWKKLLGA